MLGFQTKSIMGIVSSSILPYISLEPIGCIKLNTRHIGGHRHNSSRFWLSNLGKGYQPSPVLVNTKTMVITTSTL